MVFIKSSVLLLNLVQIDKSYVLNLVQIDKSCVLNLVQIDILTYNICHNIENALFLHQN